MPRALPMLVLAAAATSAPAATVGIDVRGADGRPVADAVVTIEGAAAPAGPIRFPWPYVVAQKNISFQPHVLIVPVGASVAFPNMDSVRHHVYSFSKPRPFQLKLYGQDQSRSILFDKPGVVALGCNIHDQMSGFVVVVATPFAARTDAAGHAEIAAVPPGNAVLAVWSPAIRAPGNRLSQPVAVPRGGLARSLVLP